MVLRHWRRLLHPHRGGTLWLKKKKGRKRRRGGGVVEKEFEDNSQNKRSSKHQVDSQRNRTRLSQKCSSHILHLLQNIPNKKTLLLLTSWTLHPFRSGVMVVQREALMPFEARDSMGKSTGGRIVQRSGKGKGNRFQKPMR
jgi:hypothetical protein